MCAVAAAVRQLSAVHVHASPALVADLHSSTTSTTESERTPALALPPCSISQVSTRDLCDPESGHQRSFECALSRTHCRRPLHKFARFFIAVLAIKALEKGARGREYYTCAGWWPL